MKRCPRCKKMMSAGHPSLIWQDWHCKCGRIIRTDKMTLKDEILR